MTGQHEPMCIEIDPDCLCVTCQHDHEDCCDDYADETELSGPVVCHVTKCPHYLKEEGPNDADT